MTRTAFVFTGCGALGAYQAGAALALEEAGIKADDVYGISSGAVNAVGYSLMGAGETADFWMNIKSFSDAFETDIWKLLFRSGDGVFRHGDKMAKWFLDAIKGKTARVDGLVYVIKAETGELIPFHLASGLTAGEDAYDYGMAACAVPGMCASWKGMVDAGTRILAPLKDAIRHGCDRIYLISGRPLGAESPRASFWPHAAAAGYYAVDSALTEILRRDLEVLRDKNLAARLAKRRSEELQIVQVGPKEIDIRIIAPDRVLGTPVDFDQCKSFYAAGLLDGDKAAKG